jgi:adenosylcobinamide-phosphate synthase
MALLLGVRLSKPGVYALNAPGRVPAGADLRQAVAWCGRAALLAAALCAAADLGLLATRQAWTS